MFWKVAGFSQPSPIEQILDKDEFTLEELLDEDDIIQECKSLNGRLVAFLRERSTVEQLVRYLVDPPLDADDPKRAYKYPFTSCEVFCCEVEAVFNTLLEDPDLMQLLFSLLDAQAPLSSKIAGYFGRVVGHLLLRKTNEVMQHLQDHPQLLESLVKHVDTTSIAEIIKRLVGADDQSSVLFLAQYATWIAETSLCELLLSKLAPGSSPEAQANAADILCAIAHTQPTPLASKLAMQDSISTLFTHALAPGQQVLVPALDVCVALIEPRRSSQAMEDAPMQDAAYRAKVAAVEAIVQYVPSLVELMQSASNSQTPAAIAAATTGSGITVLPVPYGLLAPPLGRARLKAVELLAVLLRSGSLAVETAVIQADAVKLCLQLFASYPFNNLLHHSVVSMLVAILTKSSATMLQHIFEDCQLLEWIINLPVDIRPAPIPGQEELAASKPLLRAGYMGHVTQIASTLESFSSQAHDGSLQGGGEEAQEGSSRQPGAVGEEAGAAGYLARSQAWQTYLRDVLQPRQELENTARWACGRPTATELAGLDSDNDEFQAEMELEHMVGLAQPVLYHRYHVDENEEDEDGDDEDDEEEQTLLKASAYGAQAVTDAMGNIDLNDNNNPWQHSHLHGQMAQYADEDKDQGVQGLATHLSSSSRQTGMEDDEVLLATSDEEESQRPDSTSSAPTGAMQTADVASAADETMADPAFLVPHLAGQTQAQTDGVGAAAPSGMTWQPGAPALPTQ